MLKNKIAVEQLDYVVQSALFLYNKKFKCQFRKLTKNRRRITYDTLPLNSATYMYACSGLRETVRFPINSSKLNIAR